MERCTDSRLCFVLVGSSTHAIIKKVVSFICFSLDFSTGYQRIRKNILTARTKLLKSGSCESFRTAAKRYEIFPIIFFFFLTLNYTVLKE